MRTKIIIGLIFLLPVIVLSQGEWNNWYFGVHAGVDFNSGSPVALTNCNSWFYAAHYSASVSDSLGNLLFYSDGRYIFNKIHEVMPDGNTLDAVGRQPVFGFRKPGSQNIYYMFTMDAPYFNPLPTGLRYVIIDMTMNGGLGGLQNGWEPISIPGGEETSHALTGIRHSNNRDVWIVARKFDSTYTYLSYLVTPEGLDTIPVESTSFLLLPSPGNSNIFSLRISPDGTKIIGSYDNKYEWCKFNPSTGQITPLFLFDPGEINGGSGGSEFSADSKYLYISQPAGNFVDSIYQYDATKIDSSEFKQSEINISSTLHFTKLMMAPDGKIYGSKELKDSLCVIHNPSAQGLACNFEDNAVYLEGNNSFYGLPQFLQTYYVYINGADNCKGESISFSASIWPQYDSLAWDFGDPASGINNFSNMEMPDHTYQTSGIYSVRLIAHHIDTRFDTGWLIVRVYEPPAPSLGSDITICQGDSVTFDAGTCNDCTYSWDNLTTGQIGIDTGQTFTTGVEGLYSVTVVSPEDCTGRDTVQLTVVAEALVFVTPPTLSLCSDNTTSLALNSNITSATFSWSAIASSPLVTGYSGGTGDTIAQTLVNTDTIPQIVTYNITPQNANCMFVPLDYPVMVNPLPDAYFVPGTLSICSGDTATVNLFSHVSGTTYAWTATGSSGYVSGYSDGTGSNIDQLLINSGADTEYVTYHIVPTSAEGCVGSEIDYVVTVLPTVVVTITPPTTEICSGETTGIDLQCSLSGCSFNWTAVASSPDVSGYSGGSGNAIQQILVNSSPIPQTVTYSITPSVTGCGSETTDYIATVNPLLPVSLSVTASANPVCEGITVAFTAVATNGGSTPVYQWQVNGIGAGTNNSVYAYTPDDGDIVTCLLTSSETCTSGNPASGNPITMIVAEAPVVIFTSCFDTITTTNAKPIQLRGGIPLGGVFSGAGVMGGTFFPAIAGVGTHQVTYSYTNFADCSDAGYLMLDVRLDSPFTCGDNLADIRDGKTYPTVQIGSQCWMAANVNYGESIISSRAQRDNCLVEKYCYNDLPSNCTQYGALYQWDELMRYEDTEAIQGLCPPGWNVPSEADWNQLFAFYQGNAFAGSPLLYSGYSGFNTLLTGAEFFNRSWEFDAFATFFWSSTSHGPWKAWAHVIDDYDHSVSYYPSYRANAFSVRCVRD